MGYRRLTQEERYQIQAWLATGISLRRSARLLCRSPSTVVREVRRGNTLSGYKAKFAQKRALLLRHHPFFERRKIRGKLEQYVRGKINSDWSPEQISGRMRMEGFERISYVTIYRYLERDKSLKSNLWTHLRLLRRDRRYKVSTRRRKTYLPDRVMIDQRPAIVEKRCRVGDYERDLVVGKKSSAVLLTIVDRTSRLLRIKALPRVSAKLVHEATVSLLTNEPLYTITNDNGAEFSMYNETERALRTQIYFSHPNASWERGSNENTNGLLRQYFPKKTVISCDGDYIQTIEASLNNRPRKCLGFKTPQEVHNELNSSGVALAT